MLKIVERSKIYFAVSLVVILFGAIMFFVNGGFAESVDFAGGLTMYVEMGKEVDLDEVAKLIEENTSAKISPSVQKSDGTQIVIKTINLEDSERAAMQKAILEKYGLGEEAVLQTDNVSATVGDELRAQALKAVLIAGLLMLLYITIRFEFKTGLAAIICLIHDVLIMLTVYIVFRIPIDTNFIAAMLTIIGYSINNTIVIFDRIRENYNKAKKVEFGLTVNKSIYQTLGRSISTTITTLLPVLMICILGVVSIRNFTIPILVGLLAGTYSSIFLAGPIWAWLKKVQDKIKTRKRA